LGGVMDKKVIIASTGEDMSPLLAGLKEFSTERIHLLTPADLVLEAENTRKDLEKFQIPVQIHKIEAGVWEETFRIVAEISTYEKQNEVIVNVGTGDFNTRCAATCAAFVNGLKAFSIDNKNELFLLPVLKFSYYTLLTDKKMQIMKILEENDFTSFDDLSKKTKMSLPLVSYHINGNLKSEGLKKLGLVETKEDRGKTFIKLSTLGKMLLKGYIK
jgi:DNA-binding transcriptional ArsR family regulator